MDTPAVIVWFRRDLRLADNPALTQAVKTGLPIVPLYIHQPSLSAEGAASRWWLHHALESLDRDLRSLGTRLLLLQGDASILLPQLAHTLGAASVMWNRRGEPWAVQQDEAIATALAARQITPRSFNGSWLFKPGQITSQSGQPYKVFTPFWRACLAALPPSRPLPAPLTLNAPMPVEEGVTLQSLNLLPTKPDWAAGLRQNWQVGETAAHAKLTHFLEHALTGYAVDRDKPGLEGTSHLSPHLHFGEISPRQIYWATATQPPSQDLDRFLAELGWREFSAQLLAQFPALPDEPLNGSFAAMPWRDDQTALTAWQKGMTGYPIVDAGMRQLWHTGWMHNRVRMVVASFLIKHLMIPWQQGEAWFWDTLVDADMASNAASWQWVAGCGADAAPFFRIFNPVLQGQKFDPQGTYIRRWCPQLAGLSDRHIHQPWLAPSQSLDYPNPIIDHDFARKRALAAYKALSAQAQ